MTGRANKPHYKKPPSVEVRWVDAWSDVQVDGTVEAVLVDAKPAVRHTKGYLVGENKVNVDPRFHVLVLAHDFDPPVKEGDDPTVAHVTVIPLGWILEVIYDKKPRKKAQPVVSTPPAGEPEVRSTESTS